MLTVTSMETDHMIEIEISGKLTEEDYETFQKSFDAVKQNDTPINLLVMVTDWKGMTPQAVIEDLKWLKSIKEFQKIALVSDEKGIKAAEAFGKLLPGVETKHFGQTEKGQAREWLMK
ncbi:STAS/SEC14 domain-containing protein [Marinococcus luteus]|uniref:STAS/SEC14 domain-containing protein n=1 Tax=Marinococcus luteus TaxID=1122204 RepID=UPI002ACC782F|nr:STAS/SEC14 domain-containing protein [Marinococcus luteus]MDZ5782153.1 STAS/SEC14 domain-containing protein [Marinococcus luteus]